MAYCGNCGKADATVAEIRECYSLSTSAAVEPERTPKPTITDGLWLLGGETVYKVQQSRESGRLYGKRLVDQHFEYEPGVPRTLKDGYAVPLDAETAAAFGQLYGICISCSRTLTDERSIHVGYGEKCAENHGWPWGERPEIIATVEEGSA